MGDDISGAVLAWYSDNARDLPWRAPGTTPWGVLVSEVMLQQTPVRRVLPVYERWLARWPTPRALAAAAAGDAVREWDRLGYPRRALRLHAAATAIVERHDGDVPADLADLLALPGVGSYTARAVASFAFGQRHAVVDTNVRRVLARAIAGVAQAAAPSDARDIHELEPLVPADTSDAARFAAALMELGALVCTARSPRCDVCPISMGCRWVAAGAPPATGPARSQPWAGTDRQARGRVLAVVRDAAEPVPADDLAAAWPDAAQRARALAGLLADGLVSHARDGRICLPD